MDADSPVRQGGKAAGRQCGRRDKIAAIHQGIKLLLILVPFTSIGCYVKTDGILPKSFN